MGASKQTYLGSGGQMTADRESGPATSPFGPVAPPATRLPEQTFFADPAMDRLFGVMLNLATEVFVLREQCTAMQSQLVLSGALDAAQMQAEPGPQEAANSAAAQQAFVDHLLEPLLGVQLTRGVSPGKPK